MTITTTELHNAVFNDDSLELIGKHLNSDDVNAICHFLASNPGIKSLDVRGSQIGDAGATALAANTTLTTLNVWNNQIGDAGAKALAGNTTLTTLNVSFNQIGVAGAEALAANTTLTTLYVAFNQIGDAGAEALAANTTLTTLGVSGCRIGDAGAEAIKNSRLQSIEAILTNYRDKAPKISPENIEVIQGLNAKLDKHLTTLKQATGKDFPADLSQFNDNCSKDIMATVKLLKGDLVWTAILLNLMKSIANVVISVVTLGHKRGFFALKSATETGAKALNDLNEQISNTKRGPG